MLDGVYDRSDETLRSTLDRAQGLHRLVEDIRDLSLADVGKLHPSIEQVSLDRVLGDATSAMRGQAQAKGVALELAPASGSAMADEARLRQVLANLLNNAVRHTPAEGSITIRSGPAGAATCWIEVDGYRRGHCRRGPAAHLRPLLSRHRRLGPQDSRQRPGPGHRAGAHHGHGRPNDRRRQAGRGGRRFASSCRRQREAPDRNRPRSVDKLQRYRHVATANASGDAAAIQRARGLR